MRSILEEELDIALDTRADLANQLERSAIRLNLLQVELYQDAKDEKFSRGVCFRKKDMSKSARTHTISTYVRLRGQEPVRSFKNLAKHLRRQSPQGSLDEYAQRPTHSSGVKTPSLETLVSNKPRRSSEQINVQMKLENKRLPKRLFLKPNSFL